MSDLSFSPLENRSLLRLAGKDAKSFLQNLVTNDLDGLSDSQCLYSALLTPQGKFLHDFFLIEWMDDIFIDCLTDRANDLIQRLTMYKLRADVSIENITADYQIFAAYQDDHTALSVSPQSEGTAVTQSDHITYCDPRSAKLGHRIIAKADANWAAAYPDVKTADLTAYIRHRLGLGIPEGGLDIIPEKNFLLEANFEELHGVSFSKGCYVGQELTARTKYRAKIKKRLFQFTFDGPLAAGDSISTGDKEIATVSSFEAPHGLAFMRLADWKNITEGNLSIQPEGLKFHLPDYVILPSEESE